MRESIFLKTRSAAAQMKIRLKEWERARLEIEAKRNGHSLNAEIVMRLRRSLGEDDFKEIYERIATIEQTLADRVFTPKRIA